MIEPSSNYGLELMLRENGYDWHHGNGRTAGCMESLCRCTREVG